MNPELGIRAPYLGEAAQARAALPQAEDRDDRVRARAALATEVLLAGDQERVADKTGDTGMVRGYRGGYLPVRRRAVEQGLREGEVLGVVSTNALELGVDIGELDVAVLAGYPGAIASLWQQAGRAGRRSGQSAAVLVATSAPMDQYMVSAPRIPVRDAARARAHESEQPVHPRQPPEVRRLRAAVRGRRAVRRAVVPEFLSALDTRGFCTRGGHWHWASETYPADHMSLRTVTTDNFLVIDTTRGREADEASPDHRRGGLG